MKRIVVRAPNWIGDAVMSLPALDALRSLYPRAEITVLVKAGAAPVFMNKGCDIFIYDSTGAHGGLNGRFALARELRERDFDLAVLFQNAFSAALIAFLARVPKRVGYARDLRSPFLTVPIEVTQEIRGKHQILYYLNIIDSLRPADSMVSKSLLPTPEIVINEEESQWVSKYMQELGINADAPLIGGSPGASYGPAKMWPSEKYADVLETLAKETGALPLIFGGPGDVDVASRLSSALNVKHINLAGKLTLRQFISITASLALFITNDSGPMHISSALGVPTLAIFGSTSELHTGPIGRRVKVVKEEIDCSPCFERECPKGHYACLTRITPERVLSEAKALLAHSVNGALEPCLADLRAGC